MAESFRHDYYQSDEDVVLTVYVRDIKKDTVKAGLSGNTVSF